MVQQRSLSWKRRVTFGQVLIWLVLSVVFVVVAYPFFYVLSLAVMPYAEYVKRPVHAWPSGFTLVYFEQLLRDQRLLRAYQISVLKTVVGTTLNVVSTLR